MIRYRASDFLRAIREGDRQQRICQSRTIAPPGRHAGRACVCDVRQLAKATTCKIPCAPSNRRAKGGATDGRATKPVKWSCHHLELYKVPLAARATTESAESADSSPLLIKQLTFNPRASCPRTADASHVVRHMRLCRNVDQSIWIAHQLDERSWNAQSTCLTLLSSSLLLWCADA
jgi:hypothetical protein